MTGKVAVLGNSDFVMPFSALGVDTFAAEEKGQDVAKRALEIVEGKYALVVVAENVAPMAEEVFATQQKAAVPAIVTVPFTTEPTGFAVRSLGEALKLATGINILENN